MTDAVTKPRRLSGGAILAMLIVGVVVVIGPLAFLLALTGGGDSGPSMTYNGVPVGPDGQLLDDEVHPIVGLGMMGVWSLAASLTLALTLFGLSTREERTQSPLPLLFVRFLLALVVLLVVSTLIYAVAWDSTESIFFIGSWVACGVVVAMSTRGSRWRKVVRIVLLVVLSGVIWYPVLGLLSLVGLNFYG